MSFRDLKDDEMDFNGVASNKCPVAGPKVSWPVARKACKRWLAGTDLKKELVANHIISRGFSKHSRFLGNADLLDDDDLCCKYGATYLFEQFDQMERSTDSMAKFMRIQKLLQMIVTFYFYKNQVLALLQLILEALYRSVLFSRSLVNDLFHSLKTKS